MEAASVHGVTPLHRLLYISTARRPLVEDELQQILRTSRRNNSAVGVSGLLVVGGRRFLQVLEGDEKTIGATFTRIQGDDRHLAVVSLARDEIAERTFPDWSMGFVRGGSATSGAMPGTAVAQLIAPIQDPTLHAYFTGFAQTHAAA